jgi:ribosomal protein S18 acetylase RimI-like enzyme
LHETPNSNQSTIVLAVLSDLKELWVIYEKAKTELESRQIFQWTKNYPNRTVIKNDIEQKVLYILKEGSDIIGAINISEDQEQEYATVDWKYQEDKIMVIHRLVVHPEHQRKGYAKLLMQFAEMHAIKNNYASIRLDAFSKNQGVLKFYNASGYRVSGEVYFPERVAPFFCLEKNMLKEMSFSPIR